MTEPQAPTIGDMIAKHQEIKADLEKAQEAFDAEWKPYRDALKTLETACGVLLQQQKMQNFKSDGHGTAFLRRGITAKVDNGPVFLDFVLKHNKRNMLNVGVLVDPLRDFLDEEAKRAEHDPTYQPAAAPPGVTITPYVTCTIRKA